MLIEGDVVDRHHRLAVVGEIAAEGQAEDVVVTTLHLIARQQAIERDIRGVSLGFHCSVSVPPVRSVSCSEFT